VGSTANIETDILARHVARLVRFGASADASADYSADERTLS
jgi:riboflavin synthase alpha subunit